MLAEWSFGNMLWTLIVVFFMVVYFFILFGVIMDIFRDHELSGWWKAVWLLALLVFPLITLLIYLIARGDGMAHRNIRAQQAAQQQMDAYVKETAASADPTEQIAKAKKLLDDGTIDQQEFDALKKKALS